MKRRPNRAPSMSWFLRFPLTTYPQAYVLTAENDEIRVTYFERERDAQTIWLSRKDARLLAKRINQCLDATVKR